MRLMLFVMTLALSLANTGQAIAQPLEGTVEQLRSEITLRKQAMATMDRQIKELTAEKSSGFYKAVEGYHASLVDFYSYQNDLRRHAQRTLYWQLVASYTLLALVIAVVGLGVALSFLEVRAAMQTPRQLVQAAVGAGSAAAQPNESGSQNGAAHPLPAINGAVASLELSAQRLQVTSAIAGIVILVISLGFLYLFVDRVFELKPTDLTSAHRPDEIRGEASSPPDKPEE